MSVCVGESLSLFFFAGGKGKASGHERLIIPSLPNASKTGRAKKNRRSDAVTMMVRKARREKKKESKETEKIEYRRAYSQPI